MFVKQTQRMTAAIAIGRRGLTIMAVYTVYTELQDSW